MYSSDDNEEEIEESYNSGNKLLDFYYGNKKLIWILGGILLVIIIFAIIPNKGGNDGKDEIVPNLTMISSKENISLNNSVKLIAAVTNIPNSVLAWTSSDSSIASVDTQGLVTGLKYGKADITATYTHIDQKIYTATCEVIVSEGDPNVTITNVSFPEGEVMMSIGSEFDLPVLIVPTNGYMTGVKYTSTNPSVVSVDENGKIKGLSEGISIVQLEVEPGDFSDRITVNVTKEPVETKILINPTSILFQERLIKVKIGDTIPLTYSYLPNNADINNLVWESSDSTVVTVNNGLITALKTGSSQITVKAMNGISDVMTVEVEKDIVLVDGITLLPGTNITLDVGLIYTIVPNVSPENASNKSVTYMSYNPSVATVDNGGIVTAVAPGNTAIEVKTIDGDKKAYLNVVVNGSSGGSSGGSSSAVGTVRISSDKSAVEISYNDAVNAPVNGDVKVTISYHSNVTSVKYCLYKYGSNACTPSTTAVDGYQFSIIDSGITVIRYIVYNNDKQRDVSERFVNIVGGSGSSGGTPSGGGTTNSTISFTIDSKYNTLTNKYRLVKIYGTVGNNRGIKTMYYSTAKSRADCTINTKSYSFAPYTFFGEYFKSLHAAPTYGVTYAYHHTLDSTGSFLPGPHLQLGIAKNDYLCVMAQDADSKYSKQQTWLIS